MEMALMQGSALSHFAAGRSSSGTQRCEGCGNSGLTLFSTVGSRGFPSTMLWNWRASVNHARRGTTSCRSSGGTRRDEAKNVSRTQKRRSRHVKGVTPTKPELFDELQSEEDADEDLDRFEANGGSADEDLDTFIDKIEDDTEAKGESKPNKDVNVERERWDQGTETGDETSGVEEVVDAGENTYVVKFFPEGTGGAKAARKNAQDKASDVSSVAQNTTEDVTSTAQGAAESTGKSLSGAGDDVQETLGDTAEDVSDIAQDTAQDVGSKVQAGAESTGKRLREAGRNRQDSVGDTASDVSNIAQDTAEDVTNTVQEAAEATGENLSEAGDDVRESVSDTAEDVTNTFQEAAESTGESVSAASDDVREIVDEGSGAVAEITDEVSDIVGDTAQDVLKTADETAREVGEDVQEAVGAVIESLDEVTTEGQKAFQEGGRNVRGEMEESRKELEVNASELYRETERTGDRLAQAGERVSDEAGKSLQNIQETLAAVFDDSAKAAETIGSEALRLGEVVLTAAGEAAGFQGTKEQSSASNGGVSVEERPKTRARKLDDGPKPARTQRNQEIQSKNYKSSQPGENLEEEKNKYQGLKVTVAGASGRTGRLVVEELTRKGVPVRAVVRDENSAEARDLRKLFNVEVVQADLYKYESLKTALGDSNVVISTIGARSFAFDPIGTYQGEFEGVKNLVSAAKNKGDVKKFVFVTSLGVTFLQIIPLLFWKKQSELYLQRSGLDYTIVRPGGLTNGTNPREGISMKPADTQFGGSITRQKVAEVCVAALVTPEASEKIVEIVSGRGAGRSYSDLFGSI